MVRHTLKILQQMLRNFQSVFYHFGTLCIEYLKAKENVSKGSFFFKLGFKASFP